MQRNRCLQRRQRCWAGRAQKHLSPWRVRLGPLFPHPLEVANKPTSQQTSTDGVVEFDTIFPGHYQGRATHIHISVHSGATVLPNNTYTGGTIHHISQLFFDQALITKIAQTAPYNTNRVARTSNAADMYTGYSATSAYDPFPEYVLLDANDITKGIFMWIEIGFNQKVDYSAYKTVAAYLGKDGGTDNRAFDLRKGITPPPTHG
jgi:hypothetical protein